MMTTTAAELVFMTDQTSVEQQLHNQDHKKWHFNNFLFPGAAVSSYSKDFMHNMIFFSLYLLTAYLILNVVIFLFSLNNT